jgi:hypothetical protein
MITPYFALALFDGGALAWLSAFIYKAKGMQQRTTALLMTCLDLAGVLLMVAGRIFTGGQELTDIPAGLGQAVIYGLIGATLLNLAAVYYYHLNEPDTVEAIEAQSLEDELTEEALRQARAQIKREAQALGFTLAARVTANIKYRMRLPMTPAERRQWDAKVIEGKVKDEPAEAPQYLPAPGQTPAARPAFLAWLANLPKLWRAGNRADPFPDPQPEPADTITSTTDEESA